MIAQTASGIIFWEYQRQRRNDLKKAAKEKAFEDANNEDKRVIISCQALTHYKSCTARTHLESLC